MVEHEADCPPALMGEWLAEAGCEVMVCRPWAGDAVPELDAADGWLVLGGSMGAYDDERHDWLTVVKERFRQGAAAGAPMLGICLGHQLAAVALGGEVEVNPRGQQLGVLDVEWLPGAHLDPLFAGVATPRPAVHWNDDVVTALPPGGEVLARTARGEVQAARHAPTVWGVQWHPELDARVARSWVEGERDEARREDQERVLAEVTRAEIVLVPAWRPLAARWASGVSHDLHL